MSWCWLLPCIEGSLDPFELISASDLLLQYCFQALFMLLILFENSATKRYIVSLFNLLVIAPLFFTFSLFLCVFWLRLYSLGSSGMIIPQRVDKIPKLLS